MSLGINWFRSVLAGLVSIALCQGAAAQLLERRASSVVANVVEAKGEEDFTPVEYADWQTLLADQDLSAGDLLRTGAFGGLGIAFEDRTYIRLHANTQMAVTDPGGTDRPKRFDLQLGRVWSRASKPDRPVIVETPSATAAIRGTDWFMEVLADGTARLNVLDGEVRFFNAFGTLDVAAGRSAIALPGAAPEFELQIVPVDRPRWALTPRSDWISFLPIRAVAEAEAAGPLAPVWLALAAGRPRLAGERLAAVPASDAAEVRIAGALMALMRRRPGEIGDDLGADSLPLHLQRLAQTVTIGAAIDGARFGEALERLDDYEAAQGIDLTSLALRAYLDAYAGRYGAAAAQADRAADIAPDDWRRHLLAAQIAALTADDATFQASTDAMVRLAPDDPAAWHWRGIYLAAAGGSDPATVGEAFARAASLNPERITSIVAVAQLQSLEGRYAEALGTYARALELDPAEPFAIAGKAVAHLATDRLDLARTTLDPHLGTPLGLHPEIQAARAVHDLMAGAPDRAATATGQVIAANPGRTGAAQLDAIAHWQAGRHAVALDIIANAVRLDANDPVSARIASAMAQDQYRVADALDNARAAWDTRRRNADAGLLQLPASQSGRIDIGAAFQYAGLPAHGAYYSSLARNQADANSAFGFAQLFPDPLARQSSTSLGLLLDPLAVTYPNRFATFFRAPHAQQTLDIAATTGSAGVSGLSAASDSQALVRSPRQPVALAAFLSLARLDGPVPNDASQTALLSLRAGTVRDGTHGVTGRITIDARDRALPGSFAMPDRDDDETIVNAIFDLGYTYRDSWTDRWMFRATGGTSDRTFSNPSAFGSGLDPLDYSLAVSLGLAPSQSLAARGLFDTPFSSPDEAILAVAPPAEVPVTRQLGGTLIPLLDDNDPVRRIDADLTLLSVQTRRILRRGNTDYSFGVEYGLIDSDSAIRELVFTPTGAGALVDFGQAGAITTFDIGNPLDFAYATTSRSTAWQAHASADWRPAPDWRIEAGVFPALLEDRFRSPFLNGEVSDTTRSLDPRLGLAWQGEQTQVRLALQRTRRLPGVDTIAPLGTLGLLPTRSQGVTAERTDSAILRLEHEARPGLFLHATAEHQDMQIVSAGLAGERIEEAAFFATDARLNRLAIGADVTLGNRVGLSAEYVRSDGEIDGGPLAGADLPVVPGHQARLGLTWVDPRFFRVSASLTHVSERFADGANLRELDDALILSAALAKETRDKRWLFRIDGEATSSDDNPAELGQPATESRVTIGLSRRW